MEPKISVIMSVKNGAHCLHKSIESIKNQTMSDWELIVCDDGSTDGTYKLLQDYSKKDSRIIVLHNEKSRGSAYGRNRCIEIARSNFLAIHDADDASHHERFERQLNYMKEHPEYAIVGSGWYAVSPDGTMVEHTEPFEPSALEQVRGGLFMHPSFIIRKDALSKVGYYTANEYTLRSQDYHMVMKILGAGMKLCNMPDKLYYYTVDEGTKSRSRNWKRVRGLMWIRWDSYKRNNLPIWCYFYVLKPLFTNLMPRCIMMKHYDKVYNKK